MLIERILQFALSGVVRRGSLDVVTSAGRRLTFGDGREPRVVARFRDAAAERSFLWDPELKFGELFMDGRFVVEHGSIYDLLQLVLQDARADRTKIPFRLMRGIRALKMRLERHDPRSAKRNVAHHYDLDGRLYDLFLDPDRQYSCAYFETSDQSLEDAQLAKKRHVTAKLLVEPECSVLDIGSGWGGLALYLAQVAGAGRVKGVTLSEEQLELARKNAAQAGLSGRVEFALQDYRAVEGSFDRIVSVGMFEHVGVSSFDAFFKTCAGLLAQDGVVLLHTIGLTGSPGVPNPWVRRYIFPGGHIPALSQIVPALERSGLGVTDIEVLRLHYAETLRAWRERFLGRRDEATRLYDERFCRMWEFYLALFEAAFRYEDLVVFQIQLAKRNDVVPLTRDYIAEREASLRQTEEVQRKRARAAV